MIKFIFNKKMTSSFELALILMFIISFWSTEPTQMVMPVNAGSGTFIEDFTTTNYEDQSLSNVSGWGSGSIESSKQEPVLVGSVDTPGSAQRIFIDGNYAYVGDKTGLQVINISDPTNPTLSGFWQYPSPTSQTNLRGVYVSGDFAYVAVYFRGLYAINVSDPANINQVGVGGSGSNSYVDLTISGDYIYAAADGLGHILSIQDPTNPTYVGGFLGGSNWDIIVEGNYIYYVSNPWPSIKPNLKVADISNRVNPSIVNTIRCSGQLNALTSSGHYLYIAEGPAGLQVYDFTNPSLPTLTGTLSPLTNAQAISIDGDFAYVADGSAGLTVIDISKPSSPKFVSSVSTIGSAIDVQVEGDYAYVVDGLGLKVFDIRDPVGLTHKAWDRSGTNSLAVYVDGNYIYRSEEFDGLIISNISDPLNPNKVGNYTPYNTYDAYGIYIDGNYAYLATADDGLVVLSVNTPSSPSFLDSIGSTAAADVVVDGEFAFVANSAGLSVINISHPNNLQSIGSALTGSASGVAIAGDIAYLAGSGGLRTVNISDPTAPYLVASTGGFTGYHVRVSGNYAYVTGIWGGLWIIDISDPIVAKIVTTYPITAPRGLSISGNFIFVSDKSTGILVLDITDPAKPTLIEHWQPGDTPVRFFLDIFVDGDYAYIANGIGNLRVVEVGITKGRLYTSPVVAQSTPLPPSSSEVLFLDAQLTASSTTPAGTSISYYLSADNGIHWEEVTPGVDHSFVYTGSDLRWKAILSTSDVFQTATISSISISYSTKLTEISLISPADGITTNNSLPTLNWIANLEAISYLVQIDTATSFDSANLINETVLAPSTSFSPLSDLSDGTYYWRIIANDSSGDLGFISGYRSFNIDTQGPQILPPEDIVYEQGDIGYIITWTMIETDPNWYTVTRDGWLVVDELWVGDPIIVNVDGLPRGTYTYVCTVTDDWGNLASDTVIVTVTDTTWPLIDQPEEVNYAEYTTGHNITWHPYDNNPFSYQIEKDGDIIVKTGWSGSSIIVNIDNLPRGSYTYNCTVFDLDGNSENSIVVVNVFDATNPTVNPITDITYEAGTLGYDFYWTPGDENPSTYKIERDGEIIKEESWDGLGIFVNVDNLTLGTYIYNCTVYDLDGNSASTMFLVIVIDTTNPEIGGQVSLTFEQGMVGNNITFTTFDINPANYTVVRDSDVIMIQDQPWDSSGIVVNIEGLSNGYHIIQCIVWDLAGNTADFITGVTIVDTLIPVIISENTISYEEGTTGHFISFTVNDVNTGNFEVKRDGTTIKIGTWIPGFSISIIIDGLAEGTYSFTIIATDLYNNIASRIINVEVVSVTITVTSETSNTSSETSITSSKTSVTSLEDSSETSKTSEGLYVSYWSLIAVYLCLISVVVPKKYKI